MPGDAQGVPVPHGVFGGLVTDIAPPLTVEGLSPDCQDIVFLPQEVRQREGLARLFAAAFNNNPVYQKTYVQPNEDPLNLFITVANGANLIYQENVNSSAGVRTQIGSIPSTGIITAQSATAFGREYIAASDGRHGVHVPLQYDGTHLDRVSQDGPGSAVTAADYAPAYVIDVPGTPGLQMAVTAHPIGNITQVGVVASFTAAFLFTADIPQIGEQIQVAGSSVAAYDGVWTVSNVVAAGGLNWTISYVMGVSGLAAGLGATMDTTVVIVKTTTATTFAVDGTAIIAGASVAAYDGAWLVRNITTPTNFRVLTTQFTLANGGNGTVGIGGSISSGLHRVVVMNLTRQGYITKPSPAASWTATGSQQVLVDNIPIGPANVVARILAFTGAGGANYFYIPVNFILPGTTTPVQSTVILDNTTTSASFSFADNTLFAATSIDVSGRNYFAQVVLGEVLGFFPYASRLMAWGERNKVQRFLNMGFDGGYVGALTAPSGWTVNTVGGTLGAGGAWTDGFRWVMTLIGGGEGSLSQTAYQNELGLAIIDPLTSYTARIWAQKNNAFATGNLLVKLEAASTGFVSTATIPLSSISTNGGFVQANLSLATPAVIPSDLLLTIDTSAIASGPVTLSIDEAQLLFTENPYRDALFRVSYFNAPEQFDGVTGVLGSTSDFTPIRNCFQLRNTMYFNTELGKSSTTDNGTGEPSTWIVPGVTRSVGSISVHGSDPGRIGDGDSAEQWQFTIAPEGVYVFSGGDDMKVSQEIARPTANGFPGWESINTAAWASAWINNDTENRRCYIGVPTGTATAPNVVFVLDYRNLDSAYAIANSPPYRNFGGQVIAQEIARRWTRWSLSLNCCEELARPGGDYTICFGSGNGVTPGSTFTSGNAYQLDEAKLTDDDFGQITPYRFTHFFPSPQTRLQARLGAHRVMASYFTMLISGVGLTQVTPVVNTLANAFPDLAQYPLNPDQNFDYEWDIDVTGERIAFKVGSVPAVGQTDNAFSLQDLTVTLKKDPWSPIRGTMLS